MQALMFSKSWKATRDVAHNLTSVRYEPIIASYDDTKYEIAKWSRFSRELDGRKLDRYLPVTTSDFGEMLADMLDHTAKTGIGKLVMFRNTPRYVLDPGRRWRRYQAARNGVSIDQYTSAMRQSRVIQRMLDASTEELRKAKLTLNMQLQAAEAQYDDLKYECGRMAEEVAHLRHEVARLGPDY